MLKRPLHVTPPKKTSSLPSLYRQQRALTAAKNVNPDPRIQKAIEQKQSLLSRRIGQAQAEQKLASEKN